MIRYDMIRYRRTVSQLVEATRFDSGRLAVVVMHTLARAEQARGLFVERGLLDLNS